MGPKEVALVSERPICGCLFAAFGPIPEGRHLDLCNRGVFPLQVLPAVLFLGIWPISAAVPSKKLAMSAVKGGLAVPPHFKGVC